MIWYSHVNEDSWVEREILLRGEYDQVICVTGSGERALSLMDAPSVKVFHAIDINPEANFLLELKLAALGVLGETDYLAFCGLLGEKNRFKGLTVGRILEELSPHCRVYWERRIALLHKGVAHCGHFERFLGRVRPLLKVLLGRGFEECFVRPYDSLQNFPARRWSFLLWLFSERWVYRLMGNRDPAFVASKAEPRFIARGLQQTLEEDRAMTSYIFHLVFRGGLDAMPADHLPPSLREEVLNAVRRKFSDPEFLFQFHEGDLKATVAAWPKRDFSRTFFSVSDILSFVDFNYLMSIFEMLDGENISVVFRSFLSNRVTPQQIEVLESRFKKVADVSRRDQTRMYTVYHVQI